MLQADPGAMVRVDLVWWRAQQRRWAAATSPIPMIIDA
jgi:hypothetical protein